MIGREEGKKREREMKKQFRKWKRKNKEKII